MKIQEDKKIAGLVPVLAAIVGNSLIMILKFIGSYVSGSSSMFSEAVHSVADLSNQILLLVGIKKSQKVPDKDYSYGYGQERFFWAVISACAIFFLGAGFTIYHGINSLITETEMHAGNIVFAILAISFLVESFTFYLALHEIRSRYKGIPISAALRSGDPITLAVMLEDGVAVIGVLTALTGIILTKITNNYLWDGIGSLLIGLLLGVMAIILIDKNRKYLLNKSIPKKARNKIISELESDPVIEKILDFKSSVLDIGQYRIKCEVEINGEVLVKEAIQNGSLKNEYDDIKNDYNEFIRFCADYADRVPRLLGNRIDIIEKKIITKVPEIKHIDIEVN
jgi:solute carrier family 30 (zinc transporter), member 9